MAVNIGPKIGIDGESEFRKQLNNIIQQCKTLDSEMKSVTSSFDENDQSQEKLSKQSEVLTRQIQLQIQRIEMLEKGLGEASKKYGETDTKTQKWQQAVNDATTSLNRMQKELEDINSAMETNAYDTLTKQIEEQEKEVERLRTAYQNAVLEFGDASDEAEELGRELSNVSGELKESRSAMKRAADAADDLDNSLEDAADSTNGLGNSFSDLGNIVSGNIIADGIQNIIGGIKDLYEESLEYRRIMASLEVASERAGYSAEQTAESYDILIGVLGDTQTAATTLSNLQAIGLEQEDLNTIIDASIGAWATYGDSIPIDSLSEAINETINTATVTGSFADVLNWAKVSEDDFNEILQSANSNTERANIVLRQLARQGLVDAGKEWQENNEGMMEYNQSSDDLQKSLAELSEKAEPILTGLVQLLTGVVDAINFIVDAVGKAVRVMDEDITDLMGVETDFLDLQETTTNALYSLTQAQLEEVYALVQQSDAAGYSTEYYQALADAIYQVTGENILNTESANSNTEATNKLTESTSQLNEETAETTTKLGEQALAYQNMGTELQNMTIRVAETMTNMQNAVSSAVQSQMDIFAEFEAASTVQTSTILTNMQSQVDGFNNWGEQFSQLANSTKTTSDGIAVTIDEELLQYLAEMGPEGAGYVAAFNQMTGDELAKANDLWRQSIDIKNMTTSWGEDLKTGVGELAAGGEAEFEQLSQRMNIAANNAGEYTGEGFIQGLQQTISQAEEASEEFGESNLDALKAALGVSSPSEITQQYGIWTAQGLSNGLRNGQTDVIAASRQLAQQVENTVRNGLNQSTFYSAGLNAAYGMANGIRAGRSSVVNAAASMARAAAEAARSALDIHSPSGVFEEIGRYTSEGFLVGFEQNDLKARVGELMDFQQQHVNAIMSLQYQNIDEIYSTVYTAVREGMKQVNGKDNEYMRILDNMSKRPIYTQAYFDGRPMGYMMSPYVSAAQQKETKIKNWVNGVKA